jgi:hypothetical protein
MNILPLFAVYLNFSLATTEKPSKLTRIGRSLSRTFRGIGRTFSRNKRDKLESRNIDFKQQTNNLESIPNKNIPIERMSRRPPIIPNIENKKGAAERISNILPKTFNKITSRIVPQDAISNAKGLKPKTSQIKQASPDIIKNNATFKPLNMNPLYNQNRNNHIYESIESITNAHKKKYALKKHISYSNENACIIGSNFCDDDTENDASTFYIIDNLDQTLDDSVFL